MVGVLHVVAGALIDAQGRVLIARRPEQVHQGGRWEFPGGKLEPGESAINALSRELQEELGIRPRSSRPLIQIEHDYRERRILLDLYRVSAWDGEPRGCEGQPLAWEFPQALDPALFPPADGPAILALRLPALYLITPPAAPDPTQAGGRAQLPGYLTRLRAALAAGAGAVQLRAHDLSAPAYAALSCAVAPICAAAGVPLVLNRAPEELTKLPADGWHLSSAHLHQLAARPPQAPSLLGASCHTEADLCLAARLGLDYALLSPVQQTRSHPHSHPLGWEGFAQLTRAARLPVYALGGLGPADLEPAWAHGAQGVAAIGGLWGAQLAEALSLTH
ncbi:Nudix family hydrolase [Thiorhodovibrio frisius]|uniref:8-oxo-dGTP diphosphatase n=1 Tax=Thiorhodovibrio frisius TaxID=631362 RepID=H8Z3H1_9GAMM|nr:thiamine monophosphate synthase [Thiorhodovibrio frisius]WPL24168.1 8-oxo-dGTP diphosphatase [Thiorhodovibrio frisius]